MKIWLIIAVVLPLVIVALIIAAIRTERKRKEELRAVAERLGMAYAGKDDAALAPLRNATKLFDRGGARRFTNIMHGRIEDLSAYIFDYAYTIGSGEETQRHHQTVAAFFAEQSQAAKFELRPEHFLHRMASFFGFQDIDLPEHTEFSKKFHLKGEDEAAVRAAFTPDVAERILRAEKVCIESSGQWIVIYRPQKRLKPREIEGFLREAFELTTLFV